MYFDFKTINEITGFANGEKWSGETEVREYFTVEAMRSMCPEWDIPADVREFYACMPEDAVLQAALDDMAEVVIRNRWHMA